MKKTKLCIQREDPFLKGSRGPAKNVIPDVPLAHDWTLNHPESVDIESVQDGCVWFVNIRKGRTSQGIAHYPNRTKASFYGRRIAEAFQVPYKGVRS